jgi:hypothetical protein
MLRGVPDGIRALDTRSGALNKKIKEGPEKEDRMRPEDVVLIVHV